MTHLDTPILLSRSFRYDPTMMIHRPFALLNTSILSSFVSIPDDHRAIDLPSLPLVFNDGKPGHRMASLRSHSIDVCLCLLCIHSPFISFIDPPGQSHFVMTRRWWMGHSHYWTRQYCLRSFPFPIMIVEPSICLRFLSCLMFDDLMMRCHSHSGFLVDHKLVS